MQPVYSILWQTPGRILVVAVGRGRGKCLWMGAGGEGCRELCWAQPGECGATGLYWSLSGVWEDSKAELRMLPSSLFLSLEFCLVGMELKILLELDCSCDWNSDEARRQREGHQELLFGEYLTSLCCHLFQFPVFGNLTIQKHFGVVNFSFLFLLVSRTLVFLPSHLVLLWLHGFFTKLCN